jgi:hypothetical protein
MTAHSTSLHTTANLLAYRPEVARREPIASTPVTLDGYRIDMSALNARADRVDRADAIMARAFGKVATPHGFYDPVGFVQACRRSAAQKRIRLALIYALTESEDDRQLALEWGMYSGAVECGK